MSGCGGVSAEASQVHKCMSDQNILRGCDDVLPPQVIRGFLEFNRGEFFEQHETLEHAWMAERRPVREMYQGILQLGLMCHHIRAGRYRSALKMWGRSARHLANVPDVCQGVHVEKLRLAGERLYAHLVKLGPGRIGEFDFTLFPKVEWAADGFQPDLPF